MNWNPPIPLSPREERLCKRLEKYRRFFRFFRLHRHRFFDDAFEQKLAILHPTPPRGILPLPPALLAAVVLLQAYTGASDEDAVQLAETDAKWQMCLDCLGAEEAPFSKTTLVDFRAKLIQAGLHHELLKKTVELARETKDFGPTQAASLRVALDSIPLEGAGKVEDMLNLIGRALRLLVHSVATFLLLTPEEIYAQAKLPILSAPSIKAGLDRDWDENGATEAALKNLNAEVERFQQWFLLQKYRVPPIETIIEKQKQLTRILSQNTEPDGQAGLKPHQGVAPDRQISLSDSEMRHGRKSETKRIDGYKQYVAIDLDTGLTLAAGVLPANVPEAEGADKLRPQVETFGEVKELHIDRAFLSSDWVIELDAKEPKAISGRAPNTTNKGLYTKREFKINLEKGTVQCPSGKEANIVGELAHFKLSDCRACLQRPLCQKAEAKHPRAIHIGPNEALLQKLIPNAKTPEGREKLRERVGVEHVLSHHSQRQGKTARYRGVEKNDFDACRIAAVNNLLVLDRHLREAPLRMCA